MILWHVNALHLAKNCIVMQKMNHHSLQSTQQQLAIALSMYVIQIWGIIIDASMNSLWWHHIQSHIHSSLVFYFFIYNYLSILAFCDCFCQMNQEAYSLHSFFPLSFFALLVIALHLLYHGFFIFFSHLFSCIFLFLLYVLLWKLWCNLVLCGLLLGIVFSLFHVVFLLFTFWFCNENILSMLSFFHCNINDVTSRYTTLIPQHCQSCTLSCII